MIDRAAEVHLDGPATNGSTDLEAQCRAIFPSLVTALTLFSGDAAAAQDIAQECLIRLWTKQSGRRKIDNPAAWCFVVGANLARSHSRRRQIESRAVQRLGLRAARRQPDGIDSTGEARDDDLLVALQRLPERQREALIARYYLDLSVRETAEHMSCAEGTVRALTHQGIANLRKQYAELRFEELFDG